ncbi:MAG: hypothetical protein ACRCU9_16560 [Iodobacter sp.]
MHDKLACVPDKKYKEKYSNQNILVVLGIRVKLTGADSLSVNGRTYCSFKDDEIYACDALKDKHKK